MSEQKQQKFYVYSKRIEYGSEEEASIYAEKIVNELEKQVDEFQDGESEIMKLDEKGVMYVRVPVREAYYNQ